MNSSIRASDILSMPLLFPVPLSAGGQPYFIIAIQEWAETRRGKLYFRYSLLFVRIPELLQLADDALRAGVHLGFGALDVERRVGAVAVHHAPVAW